VAEPKPPDTKPPTTWLSLRTDIFLHYKTNSVSLHALQNAF